MTTRQDLHEILGIPTPSGVTCHVPDQVLKKDNLGRCLQDQLPK